MSGFSLELGWTDDYTLVPGYEGNQILRHIANIDTGMFETGMFPGCRWSLFQLYGPFANRVPPRLLSIGHVV